MNYWSQESRKKRADQKRRELIEQRRRIADEQKRQLARREKSEQQTALEKAKNKIEKWKIYATLGIYAVGVTVMTGAKKVAIALSGGFWGWARRRKKQRFIEGDRKIDQGGVIDSDGRPVVKNAEIDKSSGASSEKVVPVAGAAALAARGQQLPRKTTESGESAQPEKNSAENDKPETSSAAGKTSSAESKTTSNETAKTEWLDADKTNYYASKLPKFLTTAEIERVRSKNSIDTLLLVGLLRDRMGVEIDPHDAYLSELWNKIHAKFDEKSSVQSVGSGAKVSSVPIDAAAPTPTGQAPETQVFADYSGPPADVIRADSGAASSPKIVDSNVSDQIDERGLTFDRNTLVDDDTSERTQKSAPKYTNDEVSSEAFAPDAPIDLPETGGFDNEILDETPVFVPKQIDFAEKLLVDNAGDAPISTDFGASNKADRSNYSTNEPAISFDDSSEKPQSRNIDKHIKSISNNHTDSVQQNTAKNSLSKNVGESLVGLFAAPFAPLPELNFASFWPNNQKFRNQRSAKNRQNPESKLSDSGRRLYDGIASEFGFDLNSFGREIDATNVEKLNLLRMLFLLASIDGLIKPKINFEPNVREINETHDVLDDSAATAGSQSSIDATLLAQYLAAMICLESVRNLRETTT